MEKLLQQYDKLLRVKKNLDGSLSIVRQSPFDTQKEHTLLTFKNVYAGTGGWILRKLISMDTTRKDLVGEVLRHNKKIFEARGDRSMHRDLADFMHSGTWKFTT